MGNKNNYVKRKLEQDIIEPEIIKKCEKNSEKEGRFFKILIVGSKACGKSSVISRIMDDKYIEDNVPTIGLDLRRKLILNNIYF